MLEITKNAIANQLEQISERADVQFRDAPKKQRFDVVAEKKEPSEEQVKSAIEDLNSTLKFLNVKRQFEINKDVDKVVVKIIDTEKNEVVMQIPSEEALKLSKNVKEMIGLLFDKKY